MSQPFLAQISMFGFNFAPKGWAQCNGQILPISQYSALFALIGTFYGGNGTSNFQLPNLQGSAALSQGSGPGLSTYSVGEQTGTTNVTLLQSNLAQHTHSLTGVTNDGSTLTAGGNQPAKAFSGGKAASYTGNYLSTNNPQTQMAPTSISSAGGSSPHNNMQPYLALTFCIALAGIFPSRN